MSIERNFTRTEIESQSEEPREIRRLKLKIDQGNKVLTGERDFGDTIYHDLKLYLSDLEGANFEVASIKQDAEILLRKLPLAELNNLGSL